MEKLCSRSVSSRRHDSGAARNYADRAIGLFQFVKLLPLYRSGFKHILIRNAECPLSLGLFSQSRSQVFSPPLPEPLIGIEGRSAAPLVRIRRIHDGKPSYTIELVDPHSLPTFRCRQARGQLIDIGLKA